MSEFIFILFIYNENKSNEITLFSFYKHITTFTKFTMKCAKFTKINKIVMYMFERSTTISGRTLNSTFNQ